MKCGFSFWGIMHGLDKTHSLDTPDGHRYGRPIFVKELLKRGHEVYALQERRDDYFGLYAEDIIEAKLPVDCLHSMRYPLEAEPDSMGAICDKANGVYFQPEEWGEFPDLDVIFMEWRWPTFKNDKLHPNHKPELYESDLDRQRQILDHYHGKIPIIVWDTDLKITPEDEKRYPGLIIADPSFETNKLTRDRVSLPFWTDWQDLFECSDPLSLYGYIGNNYERPDEFKRFYFSTAESLRDIGVQTSMYGNWLKESPERESPQSLIRNYKYVTFNHRMNFYESMKMMNKFICTTHTSKPRYYETGFMSPRYLESLAVNCPALQPASFSKVLLGKKFLVSSKADVEKLVKEIEALSLAERKSLIQEQKENLQKVGKFDVRNVIDFIESVI